MQYLNNLYKGGTCIIIGNGPSLRNVSDEFLTKYPTFGSNRIFLKFIPTFYVAINPLVVEQNRATIEVLPCAKFVRAGMGADGYQLQSSTQAPFSLDPSKWVHEGYTVTYVSLQLAFWMGFETVLLVGVDHRYAFDGKPNEKHTMTGDDPNHFDPNYFKGHEWHNPDLIQSERFYRIAHGVYEKYGRRIVNLTEGTALSVFEKGSIETWLTQS